MPAEINEIKLNTEIRQDSNKSINLNALLHEIPHKTHISPCIGKMATEPSVIE